MSIPGKQSSYGEFQIDITLKSIYEYMGVTIFIPRRSQKVKGGFVMKEMGPRSGWPPGPFTLD